MSDGPSGLVAVLARGLEHEPVAAPTRSGRGGPEEILDRGGRQQPPVGRAIGEKLQQASKLIDPIGRGDGWKLDPHGSGVWLVNNRRPFTRGRWLGFHELGDGAVKVGHPPSAFEVIVEGVKDGDLIGGEKRSIARPQGIDAAVTDSSVEGGPTDAVASDGIREG